VLLHVRKAWILSVRLRQSIIKIPTFRAQNGCDTKSSLMASSLIDIETITIRKFDLHTYVWDYIYNVILRTTKSLLNQGLLGGRVVFRITSTCTCTTSAHHH